MLTLNDTLNAANDIIRSGPTSCKRADVIVRLQKYKKLYEESIKKVNATLAALAALEAPEPARSGATISLASTSQPAAQQAIAQQAIAQQSTNTIQPVPRPIKITPLFELPAVKVSTFKQVATEGQLYYVDDAGHFAMRIAGHLFHGNIGLISDDKRCPRTLACKFPTCKKQDCMFYHDPIVFGGTDRRNYTNAGAVYTPAKAPRSGRHFGSIDNIEDDARALTADSVSYIKDRAFHDLLCAVIAANYLARGGS